ncbi:MAG: GNAT family N-acetyltransferase [Candidatus Omnitrophota bacterium]|jgi:hypothetical protein
MNEDSNLRLKLFRGKAGLNQLATDWRCLTDRIDKKSFYHLVEWYECYMDALENEPEKMFFCVLYDGDKAEAIFPFRKIKYHLLGLQINILELPNHSHVLFNDFIFVNNESPSVFLKTLFEQLKNFPDLHWDIIRLYNIPDNSSAASVILTLGNSLIISEKKRQCSYITLSPYEQLSKRFSDNFKRNLQKERKRLSRLDSISYVFVHTLPELEQAYLEFLDLESSGWKGAEGTAIKLNDRLTLFYRLLLNRYSVIGKCEIEILRHKNKAIAMALSFFTEDTCYGYKIGFDESYKYVAPGNMLIEHLLQTWGNKGNIKFFNFVSDSPWLDKWMPLRYNIFDFFIFNKTLIGILAYPLFMLKKLLRITYRSIIKPIIKSMHKNKSRGT